MTHPWKLSATEIAGLVKSLGGRVQCQDLGAPSSRQHGHGETHRSLSEDRDHRPADLAQPLERSPRCARPASYGRASLKGQPLVQRNQACERDPHERCVSAVNVGAQSPEWGL